MDTTAIIIIIGHGIIWGIICEAIASSKNVKDGFWWGFIFGFIGLIVVACSSGENKPIQINMPTNFNKNEPDKYDQLEKLAKLKDSGAITEDEYEKEKEKILKP